MKRNILTIIFFSALISSTFAQNVLPDITVRNLNGRVIVSWLNNYKKPLENIVIQRSFDSLGNFKSIGSVLNPQNKENGYPDLNPPYDKMYYRVFIYFDDGEYISGPPQKAIPEIFKHKPVDYVDLPELPEEPQLTVKKGNIPDIPTIEEKPDPILKEKKIIRIELKKDIIKKQISVADSVKTIQIKKTTEYAFPSTRIFNTKMNNLLIHLPEFATKKYMIRFYNDNNVFLFEVRKITDDYLILEKSNFIHSGWFYFEIFESGVLIEKNKFFVGKELKNSK